MTTGDGSAPVPFDDRGFAYGDGVFETVLVRNGAPTLWSYHLDRLHRGCDVLGITRPHPDVLASVFSSVAPLQVTKLVVTRGSGGRGYAPPEPSEPRIRWRSTPFSPQPGHWVLDNSARLCDLHLGHQPALAGIKHLNRLENVLARKELSSSIYIEGLLADIEGNLVEATAMNLCWHDGQQWRTPPLKQCGVAGTLRAALIESGMLDIAPLRIDALDQAQALCVVNSVQGVWPLKHVYNADDICIWTSRYSAHEALQSYAHGLLGY